MSSWWHEFLYPSNEHQRHIILLGVVLTAFALRPIRRRRQERGLIVGATGRSVARAASFTIDLARGLLIGLAILTTVVLVSGAISVIAR